MIKNHMFKAFLTGFLTIFLIGCAATPYQVDSSSPKAFIHNAIHITHSRNNSIGINILEGRKRLNLYFIDSNKASIEGNIAVEANKLLTFSYDEAIGSDRSCHVEVKATLMPNKQYAFIGGTKFDKSVIPLFPSRSCRFGIQDLGTGNLVSQ